LFVYGNYSINGLDFLYIEGLEKVVQSKINDETVLVSFIEHSDHLSYYLYERTNVNIKTLPPAIIQHDDMEINRLSFKVGEKIVLLYDCRINIPSSDIRAKSQAVKSKICNNNSCEEFFF